MSSVIRSAPRAFTDSSIQRLALFSALAGLVAGVCGSCTLRHQDDTNAQALLEDQSKGNDWPGYGRTADEGHFSPLIEISDRNVGDLGLAWSLDLPASASAVGAPLAVGGTLFIATGLSIVRALDAATGRELWSFDPEVAKVAGDKLKPAWGIRGLAWWKDRVIVGTQDGRLIALDAKSGKPLWAVQTTMPGDGRFITGAPRVFRGKVVIGHGGADSAGVRGYVTAYDAESGKQLWRFYTVPGNPAVDRDETTQIAAKTWTGEWWKYGGGGTVWNAMTYDPEFNRIYIGTGNGAPWNQKIRSPGGGDNLFVCSIVALDADTGKYVWHYQTVPGETWDMNSAMDMTLATLPIEGKERKVILHAPKNGFFYVIDREAGRLISAKPFAKVTWASSVDLKTGRPVENPEARYPKGETTVWPSGGLGAHNWQPMSYNPRLRLVYIPTSEMPGYYNDTGIDPARWSFRPGLQLNTGFNPILSFGEPGPKFASLSSLQAWDPIAQRQVWSVPLPGVINGGTMATAGNLVFQGTASGQFVAYSADKGRKLWSFDAQNGIVAQPITYRVNGRQYVTVVAGFGGGGAGLGPLAAQFGWSYREQKRRVLTFTISGTAKLPAMLPATPFQPVEDAAYRPDVAKEKAGLLLYSENCSICHGFGAISGGAAPDLRATPAILDTEALGQIVLSGGLVSQGMPRFSNLSPQELAAIQQFLRERAHAASTTK